MESMVWAISTNGMGVQLDFGIDVLIPVEPPCDNRAAWAGVHARARHLVGNPRWYVKGSKGAPLAFGKSLSESSTTEIDEIG